LQKRVKRLFQCPEVSILSRNILGISYLPLIVR
jgi:hypothetical protein